jgi:hypothetical protein
VCHWERAVAHMRVWVDGRKRLGLRSDAINVRGSRHTEAHRRVQCRIQRLQKHTQMIGHSTTSLDHTLATPYIVCYDFYVAPRREIQRPQDAFGTAQRLCGIPCSRGGRLVSRRNVSEHNEKRPRHDHPSALPLVCSGYPTLLPMHQIPTEHSATTLTASQKKN